VGSGAEEYALHPLQARVQRVKKEKWMNVKLNKSKSQVLQYPHARDKMMSPEGQKTDSSIDSN
jgi:hypothetical protein